MCLLLVAAACSSSGSPARKAAPAPLKPRIYAALGDSYAAGEGLPPFEADSGACHRSPSAYPRLVAAQEGSALAFAPCTGARVPDVVGTPGQLASVDPASDLVTVTIGGNDAGFASVVGECVVGADPCSHLDAQVEAALVTLGPTLEAAYRQIRARAPSARLLVVGYPQVVADPATVDLDTCPAVGTILPSRRITADDARWLRAKGDRLSDVVSRAAKAAGASYVDVSTDFSGHEACTPGPWLTGVVLTDLKASFHPTAAGQAELARLVTRALA
ncbi:MAG: SGNH/GDSL hydrolase family protein [Actinomycetota bacterium]|nr:SGNH/GDSL hydrolase family protein [Actinomycetota bacterium]